MTEFTLTVATSADGFIAQHSSHTAQSWASPEEQMLFFQDVEAADWSIMGRNTHEAADKPDRRRIIFSSKIHGWKRPTQLWLNPESTVPEALADLVSNVHPLSKGLILGGTRVHDWFLDHGRIDRVHLTIEPVTFGAGLPIFSGLQPTDPIEVFEARGFRIASEERLNSAGTRYLVLEGS